MGKHRHLKKKIGLKGALGTGVWAAIIFEDANPLTQMPSFRNQRAVRREPVVRSDDMMDLVRTPPPVPIDQKLLAEFRRGGAPELDASHQQQQSWPSRRPPPVFPTPSAPVRRTRQVGGGSDDAYDKVARLEQQVQSLSATVQSWHEILNEITQAVFPQLATALVDLPYYDNLPETSEDLRHATGVIRADTVGTLIFPQVERAGLLFMRLRTTASATGAVKQYYVPVTNEKLTTTELHQYARINSADDKFFDGFHMAGEPNPLANVEGDEGGL